MRRGHPNDLILSIPIALVVVVIALAGLGLLRRYSPSLARELEQTQARIPKKISTSTNGAFMEAELSCGPRRLGCLSQRRLSGNLPAATQVFTRLLVAERGRTQRWTPAARHVLFFTRKGASPTPGLP